MTYTYNMFLKKIETGEISLDFVSQRLLKSKLNETSTPEDVERFMRSRHIEVRETSPEQAAYEEYIKILPRLSELQKGDEGPEFGDLASVALYKPSEPRIAEILALQGELEELTPLAQKWAKFTGSKLPSWIKWVQKEDGSWDSLQQH